ncbi:MAG: tail fiber domain-containing protein [Planctomycetaceae bacterium]
MATLERIATVPNSVDNVASVQTSLTAAQMQNGFGPALAFTAMDADDVANDLGFIGAVRNGADNTGDIVLRPVSSGSSIERMRVTNGGDVGIGRTAPEQRLHLGELGSVAIRLSDIDANPLDWDIEASNSQFTITADPDSLTFKRIGLGISASNGHVSVGGTPGASDFQVHDATGGTTIFSSMNAGDTTFTSSSSRTLKENIRPYESQDLLDKLAEVRVMNYDWRKEVFRDDEERKDRLGLIAEDFHTILGRGSDKVINGQEVQMVLWIAVQELHQYNQTVRRENAALRTRLERVEARLAAE